MVSPWKMVVLPINEHGGSTPRKMMAFMRDLIMICSGIMWINSGFIVINSLAGGLEHFVQELVGISTSVFKLWYV